jgi:hypothetical protein
MIRPALPRLLTFTLACLLLPPARAQEVHFGGGKDAAQNDTATPATAPEDAPHHAEPSTPEQAARPARNQDEQDGTPSILAPAFQPPGKDLPPPPEWPRYSLDASHQDVNELIVGFAKQAGQSVTLLDDYPFRVSLTFQDLPFEQGLRRILEAADLEYVRTAEGYLVGLPSDLKLHSTTPDDEIIDAVYRCRRIGAQSLVDAFTALFADADLKVAPGPEFLTPVVDNASGGGRSDSSGSSSAGGIKALAAVDRNYRTHDVVFSGPAKVVRRALSLARKFDRPRKQVQVNVRVVEISSTVSRDLGVDWLDSVSLKTTEQADASSSQSGTNDSVNGIKLGKFVHSPVALNATLNFLESVGKAKTLTNPSLLVLDGERSFIMAGTKYYYPKLDDRNVGTGSADYTVEALNLGIYLQVGVQVGLDDDITLTIYPQVDSLINFQPINGGSYPIISSREEQATVRAVEGDVIVLGGLSQDSETSTDANVPYLSRIPLLGHLFANHQKSQAHDELLFFLTPKLLPDQPRPLDMKLQVEQRPAAGHS